MKCGKRGTLITKLTLTGLIVFDHVSCQKRYQDIRRPVAVTGAFANRREVNMYDFLRG